MGLQKFKDHFILLAEAGFIAINQADEDAAIKLFKASEVLDPKNVLPKIGIGYMHLCKLELKQAAKAFEEILAKDPHNEMAKAFLGLSMSLNPAEITKGEKVLEEAAHKSKDPMVKGLATSSLEFVNKFVKKAPHPAQTQPHSKKEKHK
ncbi:MAG: SctF chaperone SctG [Candidatus Melainabacteria bacterium]|nr:SctF chaperone SctG [Candidatus Melainabacteria bacterium]